VRERDGSRAGYIGANDGLNRSRVWRWARFAREERPTVRPDDASVSIPCSTGRFQQRRILL